MTKQSDEFFRLIEDGACRNLPTVWFFPDQAGNVETLDNIKKALESDRFLSLMKVAEGPGQSGKYKHRIITLFRKDFWKDFI